MKEGWTYKKLGEVCEIFNGNSINADYKKKHFYGATDGLAFIATKDVSTKGEIDYENGVRIPNYNEYKIAPANSVFICAEGGSAGKKFAFVEQDVCFGNKLFCLNPKTNSLIGKHVYYYIQSDNFKEQFYSLLTGLIGGVSAKKFQSIEMPVPPLSEQQRIVSRLDASFAHIDALKANAEKQLSDAKALFQKALEKAMEPKEGWEEKKLGDICSDIRYGTSIPSNENGEYKYLRMNNITNDGFLDVSHYKKISLPEKELEKCLVKRGDIIFNRTNSRELVGKSCVFTEDEKMVIAGYLIRIRLIEGFEPQFITYNMNLQRSLGLFQHLIVGAVHQANISANNIQKVIISYPPLSEQQAIVAQLDQLSEKVKRLQEIQEKIIKECDALKQAILREVFE